jgi:hypothetical protein
MPIAFPFTFVADMSAKKKPGMRVSDTRTSTGKLTSVSVPV